MKTHKPKIGLIASTRQVAQMAEEVSAALHMLDQVDIVEASLRECVEVSRRMEREEYDVIVARGGTAERIMTEVSLPVVMIPVTGQEIFQAIYRAKQVSGLASPRIAILPFAGMRLDVELFANTLGVELGVFPPESLWDSDVPMVLAKARRFKPDVVIGGLQCVKLAEEQGLKNVFLASSFDSLKTALDEARKVVYAVRLEQTRARRLKVLIDSIQEGIFYVDGRGLIQLANPAAQRMMGLSLGQLLNKPVSRVMDISGLNKCLSGELEQTEEVVNVGGGTLVASIYSLGSAGGGFEAMISFHESRIISRMDARIRDSLYSKGLTAGYNFKDILGPSEELAKAKKTAARFAALDSNILILGETGSGKELFAQSIHNASGFSQGPFVAVNCAALPPTLLESELFGYEEGAFTGANRKGKPGLIELSHGGTLFLDEISEMDHYGQIRLLRFLQERQIMRLGGGKYFSVHSRIIAASNRNLRALVAEGQFREDLYFRLKVLRLQVPPLRERRGDVAYLARAMLQRWQSQLNRELSISGEAMRLLSDYNWPGNVRELSNVIEFLAAAAQDGTVGVELVREALADNDLHPLSGPAEPSPVARPAPADSERTRLIAALTEAGGNHAQAAAALGMHRSTLFRKIKKHDIRPVLR